MSRDFDAIIIGSGPGGSTAAEILTEAGLSVLIFERGRNHLIDLDNPAVLPQRFSNDELKYMTRHFLGPDPWAEPRTFRTSAADGDRQLIIPRRQLGQDIISGSGASDIISGAGADVLGFDLGARDNSAGRVGDRAGDGAAIALGINRQR